MVLIPIRIDVTFPCGVRLIDTLIIDPNVSYTTTEELAYMVISDAEVHGVVPSSKHFTGRTPILSSTQPNYNQHILSLVEQQIQHQLTNYRLKLSDKNNNSNNNKNNHIYSSLHKIHLNLVDHNIHIMDEFTFDSNTTCPIMVAESIVKDLELPYTMIPCIVTAILEQVHGIVHPSPQSSSEKRTIAVHKENKEMNAVHDYMYHTHFSKNENIHNK